jgi:hypothetical protein
MALLILALTFLTTHDIPESFFVLLNTIILFQDKVVIFTPKPQTGGPGFDFGGFSSREIGKRVRSPC